MHSSYYVSPTVRHRSAFLGRGNLARVASQFYRQFLSPRVPGYERIKDTRSFVRLEFYRHDEYSRVEPHIPSCQGSALYEVTAILSFDVSYIGIIQYLKPLVHKDFSPKLPGFRTLPVARSHEGLSAEFTSAVHTPRPFGEPRDFPLAELNKLSLSATNNEQGTDKACLVSK